MRKMYNFGYKIFLANVLEIIFSNLYIILIAKYLSVSIAGLYIFADRIKELVVNQLFLSIQSVTYPALAKIQNDDIRLKSAYKKIISITTFLLFPALLFLAALAEPIFKLLLPAKWLPAAPYLQLMCLSSVLYPIHAINLNILKVKGRSDLFLYLEIIKKILITIVIIVSFKYGIYGILWGQVISSILVYVPNSYFSAKLINYPVSEQLKDFIPTLLATSIIAILGYLTSQHIEWHPLLQIIVIGCIMSIVYLVAAYFNKLYALTYIYNVIKTRIS